MAPELLGPIYFGPVHDRPGLVQAWDDMKRTVHEYLDRSDATRGKMTCLALFRYGLKIGRQRPTLPPARLVSSDGAVRTDRFGCRSQISRTYSSSVAAEAELLAFQGDPDTSDTCAILLYLLLFWAVPG